jgi:phosphatidylglycerophosphate synthase
MVSLLWKGDTRETTLNRSRVNARYRQLVPNGLSAARFALGAVFPFVPAEVRVWAVAAAALSDALDGLAARWLRAESDTGRLLDPVADKFFVLVLAGTLIAEGTLHPLWALGLALRDITVLVGLVYVIARHQWARGRRLRPSPLGKCTTAVQFVALLVIVIWDRAPVWVLAPTALLSALAALDYARAFLRAGVGSPEPTQSAE